MPMAMITNTRLAVHKMWRVYTLFRKDIQVRVCIAFDAITIYYYLKCLQCFHFGFYNQAKGSHSSIHV
jgi:hypothetical protein